MMACGVSGRFGCDETRFRQCVGGRNPWKHGGHGTPESNGDMYMRNMGRPLYRAATLKNNLNCPKIEGFGD
jgi:hypothetical protein